MRKSKFTEAQIVGILREHEAGKKIGEICREHGISQPTFYNWKSKYGGLDANLFERLSEVREETVHWLWSYNNERPHESLQDLSPRAFLLKRGQLSTAHAPAADLPTFQQDIHHTNEKINTFTKYRA